jgi:hypothetical protein
VRSEEVGIALEGGGVKRVADACYLIACGVVSVLEDLHETCDLLVRIERRALTLASTTAATVQLGMII